MKDLAFNHLRWCVTFRDPQGHKHFYESPAVSLPEKVVQDLLAAQEKLEEHMRLILIEKDTCELRTELKFFS